MDTVNLQMVARTLPGKQFEVGRWLRTLVAAALRRAGTASPDGAEIADGADTAGVADDAHVTASR